MKVYTFIQNVYENYFVAVFEHAVHTSTINLQMHLHNFHLKHFKTFKATPKYFDFSDHHQGVSSFLAKVIIYS